MATYASYITDTRRLLHDANGNFYSDAELTDYINDARIRVVRDTGCLRALQSYTTVTGQETIQFSQLPQSTNTLDILNINVFWGNTRAPLRYYPWTVFNAQLRVWQNYLGLPIAFSMYGASTIYIGPAPDQAYTCEIDTIVMPSILNSSSQVETIPEPYTAPVAYYAAHKAKYKEQSFGEAEIFETQYKKQVMAVLASIQTRRITSPYP